MPNVKDDDHQTAAFRPEDHAIVADTQSKVSFTAFKLAYVALLGRGIAAEAARMRSAAWCSIRRRSGSAGAVQTTSFTARNRRQQSIHHACMPPRPQRLPPSHPQIRGSSSMGASIRL